MGSLFPCLEDEIGWECLVRVELNSHHNLRCVCKSWNVALKSPHFYQERKRLKISEQRICILHDTPGPRDRVSVYDLAEKKCKTLAIPAEIYAIEHCHFVKQKLVFITHMSLHCGRNCVWLYDFACSKWRQDAKAPKLRTEFATAADEEGGLIYMAGGYSRLGAEPVRSASVYNVEEDKWDLLPDMNNFRGVFAEGKFYVMDNRYCRTIEVFDSYTRSWKTMENRFNSSHYFLSAFGRLHCFSDKGLIEYDYRWDTVQGRSFYLLAPPSDQTGGAFKCIGIDRPLGFQGYAIHAATLEL
ncbi:F-box/kelch-repeat protein At1g80440-like [Cryptomeria japonica]|uniref:F-box/kelch-repeat protein At1g80440-like n=1 Tax=Cryptomeria japonica TaxID=3369 RepID=UPI0027DA760E|nr:F-box/kelch-repeat protein At1g80440-like [Cryptomeria japonica]